MDRTVPANYRRGKPISKHIFILVPSLRPVGPIKGAIALCNALATSRPVTLAALKPGPGADAYLEPGVRLVCLGGHDNWRKRRMAYRNLLKSAGGRDQAASISLCFSADLMNLFCRRNAIICSSVRGNLLKNYRMDYGLAGTLLAVTHLALLRFFDHVVAMTSAMARQVRFYAGRRPEIIGNFVDESSLERYRRNHSTVNKPIRFVFLGSLTPRKHPLLLLKAFHALYRRGMHVHLDLIGDGPLRLKIQAAVARQGLKSAVILHGQMADPYDLVAQADAMVLPSLSEGLPRAALEALYLGVPCVLRAADGNGELIQAGFNGALFSEDEELPGAMLQTARWSVNRKDHRTSLLPASYRQNHAAMQYLALIEGRP